MTSRRLAVPLACAMALATLSAAAPSSRATAAAAASSRATTAAVASGPSPTVWLCRPGMAHDPCTSSLTTTVVAAGGSMSLQPATPAASSRFDCIYVYPTVSTESTDNADLRVQPAEIDAAKAQASRFSTVCRVWSPIYRQITLAGLAAGLTGSLPASASATAYDSVRAGFKDYLAHDNDGRPIVLIGHSQGAAMLILLLSRLVDADPALRDRLVMAIVLGGNVEVPTGKLVGGSFEHIPACDRTGEIGCVLAYSSFPSQPPPAAFFGRPGTGVSLQSGQTRTAGLQVVCVNPAALSGGSAILSPYFLSQGKLATPWVSFPGLYEARCEQGGGASWLDVTKATGPSDHRPTVTENLGPDWGYHDVDVNLALGNLVADVAAAERSWSATHRPAAS